MFLVTHPDTNPAGEGLTLVNFSITYLLLTEFEVRTVSYGPSFFPLIYGPSAKRVGYKSTGKKRGSVTYSTDRENEVSKIFIISLRLTGARQGNYCSLSEAEGSTATKNAVPKSQKLNLLGC